MKLNYRILAKEKVHQLRSIAKLQHSYQLVNYGHGLERATNEQQEKVQEIKNCFTKPFNVEKKPFRYVTLAKFFFVQFFLMEPFCIRCDADWRQCRIFIDWKTRSSIYRTH